MEVLNWAFMKVIYLGLNGGFLLGPEWRLFTWALMELVYAWAFIEVVCLGLNEVFFCLGLHGGYRILTLGPMDVL